MNSYLQSTLDTAFSISTFLRNQIPVASATSVSDLQLEGLLTITNEENSNPLSYLISEEYSLPKVINIRYHISLNIIIPTIYY